ncbi:hypothetical protein GY12_05060 [Micrococcus luteus]|nr:hypothetical protein GY12_05060 [Micrococcus luteus]
MRARAPIVRPWKARSSAITRVRRPDGSSAPWRRASLNAASLASVPEFAKNTVEPAGAPASSSRRSARRICGSEVKRLDTWPSVAICSDTARTSAGWPWPSAFTAMPASRSV